MKGLFIIMGLSGALLVTACDSKGHRVSLQKTLAEKKNKTEKDNADQAAANSVRKALTDEKCFRIDQAFFAIRDLKDQKLVIHVYEKQLGTLNLATDKFNFGGKADANLLATRFMQPSSSPSAWVMKTSDFGSEISESLGALINPTLNKDCTILTKAAISIPSMPPKNETYAVVVANAHQLVVRNVLKADDVIEYKIRENGQLVISQYSAGGEVCGKSFSHQMQSYVVDYSGQSDTVELDPTYASAIKLALAARFPTDIIIPEAKDITGSMSRVEVPFSSLWMIQQEMEDSAYRAPACPKPSAI